MKNAIFALSLAAVAVSCTQASEEAVIETTNDSITMHLDSLEDAAYDVEGEEASAE
jgi:outer membrane lipoprotein-sorting protein